MGGTYHTTHTDINHTCRSIKSFQFQAPDLPSFSGSFEPFASPVNKKLLKMAIEIVRFPITNGDFP